MHALKKNHYSYQKIRIKYFYICTFENYVFLHKVIFLQVKIKWKVLFKSIMSKLHPDTEGLLNDI